MDWDKAAKSINKSINKVNIKQHAHDQRKRKQELKEEYRRLTLVRGCGPSSFIGKKKTVVYHCSVLIVEKQPGEVRVSSSIDSIKQSDVTGTTDARAFITAVIQGVINIKELHRCHKINRACCGNNVGGGGGGGNYTEKKEGAENETRSHLHCLCLTKIIVHSNNTYFRQMLGSYVSKWKKKGWIAKSTGVAPEALDLLKSYEIIRRGITIIFTSTKAKPKSTKPIS
jgi:hypothetical protein